MKIVETRGLALDGVKVIQFGRFPDDRGYFTEHYRKSDLLAREELGLSEFLQCNESYSRAGTVRGLHFQWQPPMGKLVRTVSGRMVDFILDVRKGSPTLGKIIGYDLPSRLDSDTAEWIWIPSGFAHGNLFPEDTLIEYMCTAEYGPGKESGVSPLAPDLDWSLCDPELKRLFDSIVPATKLMTQKDREAHSLASWLADPNSDHFRY